MFLQYAQLAQDCFITILLKYYTLEFEIFKKKINT